MPADRHESALVAADVTLQEAQVEDHRDGIATEGVLGDAHAPDQDGRAGVADQFGEFLHAAARQAGLFFERGPIDFFRFRFEFGQAFGVLLDEIAVLPATRQNDFHHPVQERDITALRDGKPIIHEVGAEERAAGRGGDPIAFHARLAVRIYEHDFRA